ncbi:rhomboid family protein [Delftia acidovorans]|uniref:rhomboid family intramembrane serine protease n=1 Tax=Delftia acidovorans TaxID=80866 RepID=UPI000502E2C6|nr:rhomboid family intramembrane serine protease [Delftia acidovorans]KFJ11909.1 rhomboid family protein [Delftia acidovorans]QQB49029.1 rhomboid family intramembrane serine protease [Delftia acidovorans]
MFYAIPLEDRPRWSNPPWMTLLIILANVLVFFGPQRSEERAQQAAAQFYAASALPGIELPRFVDWLERTDSPMAKQAKALQKRGLVEPLLQRMEREPKFLALLRSGQIVPESDPLHERWQTDRSRYEALQPEPFTTRWAKNYALDAPMRPVTWITAAFLHVDTSHLVGNMLFLFMFGFSVELMLGRGTYLLFYLLGAVGGSVLSGWAYAGTGSYGLGASGAVAALMGMYAVMYRLRRVRFFYQLFFYFNYVTAPALILLPAWIANEVLQHFFSGQSAGYMAHLGGLLTGAALMALHLRRKPRAALAGHHSAPDDGFDAHVANARRLGQALDMEGALRAWRAAAQLRPADAEVLRAWFAAARYVPASEDFHRAARRIFRLPARDAATLAWQHDSYRIYLDLARPGARIAPEDMARLVRRFTRARAFDDAEKLCHALLQAAPGQPGLGETLCLLVNGLLQQGLAQRARAWLPQLQRWAPDEAVTRLLLDGQARSQATA